MFCCPCCSHLSTIFNNIVEPEWGVTMGCNCEQCEQKNIVQSCFHHRRYEWVGFYVNLSTLSYSGNLTINVQSNHHSTDFVL